MATTRCRAEGAFQRLVEQSQRTNIKLRELADEIVRKANTAASRNQDWMGSTFATCGRRRSR
jgi:hypothetical protein